MAKVSLLHLPTTLLAFLVIGRCSLALECYGAAFGLIGANGWTSCPGTATKPGGALSCCGNASECGTDGLCRGTNNNGSYSWYQAGCTDSTFDDPVCRKNCQSYTSTFVEWLSSEQKWMCCGNGGCNGTITDDTFSADSPQDWKQVLSASSSSSSTTSTQSSTSTTAPATTTVTSSASTTSSGSAATSNASQSSGGSGGLSTGAKAGIGVAVAVSVLALIAAVIAIVMLRRNRRYSAPVETVDEKRADDERERRATTGTVPPSYEQVVEIGDSEPARELGSTPVHEMPASIRPKA